MGTGASKPEWMGADQWEEMKLTDAETINEICGFDYSQFDEPEDDL
jgi:hypothetical protein